MIRSMTAFARTVQVQDSMEIGVEIRSYNSRYLDIALRLPHDYPGLEDRVKKEVSSRMTRGRIEVSIFIRDSYEPEDLYGVDSAKARSFHAALVQLKEALKMTGDIPLDLVAGAPGVIRVQTAEKDMERCWKALQPCLAEALEDLDQMRSAEGRALENDFTARLEKIRRHLKAVESRAGNHVNETRSRLEERLSTLITKEMEIDPARIVQEAAVLAVKRDISEEITRSGSHLDQFREIVASPEPAGKKLNFLLQEINREFNTMGAKAEDVSVSHAVVEVKAELEKIREQILNIE